MESEYRAQERGSKSDYARYLAGMDASMRQKVALTAAHLLCEGRIADMGTGSGGASFALATLYPRLEVVGVDVSATMVELASARFVLPNLRFVLGDAAGRVFAPGSLDGILSSSVLHHVTSFNGYAYEAARDALAAQTEQLVEHGVLVVRDFLAPEHQDVFVDLPAHDGDDSSDPRTCSTAALFERFSREYRPLSDKPGFALTEVAACDRAENLAPGFRRYRTTAKLATEFILRKDYRDDWESEVKEEYTYFSQAEFEAVFASLGLRVLASTPVFNPWIVQHRYRGKFAWFGVDGASLEPPATNYLIVGERVPDGQGVTFQVSERRALLGFLQLEHYRDRRSGYVRDLVRRPHMTFDVVPWFEEHDALYVLARASYPRPVLIAEPESSRPLDGSRACPWVVEPLTFIQGDRPMGQSVEETLSGYVGLGTELLLAFEQGSTYYPSPGGVSEQIQSVFVQLTPTFVKRDLGARSGFSSSGRVQAIEAEQVLRAAQVGGLPDARLELNVYDLLARRGRDWGPWIGDEIELVESTKPGAIATLAQLFDRPARRAFERVADRSEPFLDLVCREISELDASGRVIARKELEYVVPLHRQAVTISIAFLRRAGGEVYFGVHDDDLPAAQCFEGRSELLVVPAWRAPRELASMGDAHHFVRSIARSAHGLDVQRVFSLGGRYYPTPGATPEVVHPFVAEVTSEHATTAPLTWIALPELAREARRLRDGHLRIAVMRAAHAVLGALTCDSP